jgi:threonyl-tRNA synthetase
MRVRGFTQDDGHVFCTEEQIASEVSAFHRQANKVYSDFGFRSVDIKLALRPKDRIGTDEIWDRAEAMLRTALSSCGVTWTELPGEGAFYGPKIEYHLKDSLGRPWQVGTMQVDFSMPGRLGAEYVSEDNVRRVPVMLHRAIVGSMERFIGILIEHYAGSLPLWIAPLQVSVLPISEKHAAYAHEVRGMLAAAGFRTEVDARNEKVNFRIREQAMQKIPYILVVGDVEATAGTVSVRSRDDPELVQVTVEHIIEVLNKKMTHKN